MKGFDKLVRVKIKIKDILNDRKISQKYLAEITGIRESTISDFVRGIRTVINIQHLETIANKLGISDIRELIDFVEEK